MTPRRGEGRHSGAPRHREAAALSPYLEQHAGGGDLKADVSRLTRRKLIGGPKRLALLRGGGAALAGAEQHRR